MLAPVPLMHLPSSPSPVYYSPAINQAPRSSFDVIGPATLLLFKQWNPAAHTHKCPPVLNNNDKIQPLHSSGTSALSPLAPRPICPCHPSHTLTDAPPQTIPSGRRARRPAIQYLLLHHCCPSSILPCPRSYFLLLLPMASRQRGTRAFHCILSTT